MLRQFYTVSDETCDEIYVKRSQFIANVYPVSSENEVKEILSMIKKKYKDAKHYVFAYRFSNEQERYSDDGEPSGTAGVPILDILRGNNLYNVLIVVTRYFGGTLLGTGGLVKAYSDAAKLALEKAKIIEKHLAVEYNVEINYNDYNTIQHFCSKNDFIIVDSSFADNIVLTIQMVEEKEEIFTKDITEILGGKITIKNIRKDFYIGKY